jgi:hypothetical protein
MTSTYDQDMRHRGQRGRAKARPLPEHEAIVSYDEVAEILIETFPASDPPSWIPLARVGRARPKADVGIKCHELLGSHFIWRPYATTKIHLACRQASRCFG